MNPIKLLFHSGKLWYSEKPVPKKPVACLGKGFCCDGRRCDSLQYDDDLKDWLSTAYKVVNPEVVMVGRLPMIDGESITLPDGYGIEKQYLASHMASGGSFVEVGKFLNEKHSKTPGYATKIVAIITLLDNGHKIDYAVMDEFTTEGADVPAQKEQGTTPTNQFQADQYLQDFVKHFDKFRNNSLFEASLLHWMETGKPSGSFMQAIVEFTGNWHKAGANAVDMANRIINKDRDAELASLRQQLQEKDELLLQEAGKAMRYSQTIEDQKKENVELRRELEEKGREIDALRNVLKDDRRIHENDAESFDRQIFSLNDRIKQLTDGFNNAKEENAELRSEIKQLRGEVWNWKEYVDVDIEMYQLRLRELDAALRELSELKAREKELMMIAYRLVRSEPDGIEMNHAVVVVDEFTKPDNSAHGYTEGFDYEAFNRSSSAVVEPSESQESMLHEIMENYEDWKLYNEDNANNFDLFVQSELQKFTITRK